MLQVIIIVLSITSGGLAIWLVYDLWKTRNFSVSDRLATLGILVAIIAIFASSSFNSLTDSGANDSSSEAMKLLEIARNWPIVDDEIETFEDNHRDWKINVPPGEYSIVKRTIVDGEFLWDYEILPDNEGVSSETTAPFNPVSNFYLSVKGKLISGDRNISNYDLEFREQKGRKYFYRIKDSREFRVSLQLEGKWNPDPISWTEAKAIRPGIYNQITVIASESQLYFYINDEFVGKIEDKLTGGNVGLVVAGSGPGKMTVAFDDFELRTPPR